MIDNLTTAMARLPEPSPPATFQAHVMARIARETDRQGVVPAGATAPGARRDSPVWLWTLVAGLVVVIGASVYGWLGAGLLPSLTTPLIGRGRPELIPMEGPIALTIALGLLVYLGGLFAPLARDPRRQRPTN